MVTKKISLDVWEKNDIFISAIQGEVNSRFLEITIKDKNNHFDLTDKSVQIYLIKPDGTEIFNSVEIIDAVKGVIGIGLTSQMSDIGGVITECEIRIEAENGAILKVTGLKINIQKSMGNDALESTNEFTALGTAMSNVMNMNKHMASTSNPHTVTIEQIGAIANTEKAQNNGIATLDSNGKLVQMPDSNDIGAIPISAKGTANGVAVLNSNGKLISSQLDTSSDDTKIKLINLSEEVQNAMAGTAAVISSVADGSLTTSKYADSSITSSKLADSTAVQQINGFDGNIGNHIEGDPSGNPASASTGEWYYCLDYTGQKSNNIMTNEGQLLEQQLREYNGFDPDLEDLDIPSGFLNVTSYIDVPEGMIKIGNQQAVKRNIPVNESSLKYLPIIIRPSDTSYGGEDITLTAEFMLVPTEATNLTSTSCTSLYTSILDSSHNNYANPAQTYKTTNVNFEFHKVYRLRQVLKDVIPNPTGIMFNIMFKNQAVAFDIIYSRLSITKGAYPLSEIPVTKRELYDIVHGTAEKSEKEIIAPTNIYVTSNDISGTTSDTFSKARQYSTALYLDHMVETTNDKNMVFTDYPNGEGDKYYFTAPAYHNGSSLIINGGENINTLTKTVAITSNQYNISSTTVTQRSTKASISKSIYPKVLFIGDSITYAVGANSGAGNAELPFWAYTKKFFEMDRIDAGNNDNEYNFMSLGRASNLTIPIDYNGVTTTVSGSSEGWSGCMLANHLHHASGLRPSQESWDLLGLGDGTGTDYTGSDAQKSLWALTNQVTTSAPPNPFFDNSKTGSTKFSITKWLERYRTHDDSGNKLTLDSANLGTNITTQEQLDSYHVCTPTHIVLQHGRNDMGYYPTSTFLTNIQQFITAVKAELPNVVIGIALTPDHPGTFFKERYPEMINMHDMSAGHSKTYNGVKRIMETFGNMERNNVYIIPNYFVQPTAWGCMLQGVPMVESMLGVKRYEQEKFQKYRVLGSGVTNHPGSQAHLAYAYQVYSWLKYVMSKEL